MGKKKKRQELTVCLEGETAGLLSKDPAGAIAFRYAPEWLQKKESFPVSYSLPLREEVYAGPEARFFFDNLLPDNAALREKIAAVTSATSNETFDLLASIGKDCVGALQFFPSSVSFPRNAEFSAKEITRPEIAEILKKLYVSPLGPLGREDFRISLAGVHEKTALLKKNEKWFLPLAATPTTHILKPPIGKLPNGIDLTTSVENEWLCLQICKRFGLPVSHANMETFGGKPCLVVERFDRRWAGGICHRLPQEDMCQALGVPSERKYESEGGPGIADIMELLNVSNKRDHDRMIFFKAQIVFQIIGAVDGHAKNFAWFLSPRGTALAPLYDVLTIYPALAKRNLEIKEAKLAMSVGGSRKYRIRDIYKRHWEESARKTGLHKNFLDEIFESIRKSLQELKTNPVPLPKGFPRWLYDATMAGIQRCVPQLFQSA